MTVIPDNLLDWFSHNLFIAVPHWPQLLHLFSCLCVLMLFYLHIFWSYGVSITEFKTRRPKGVGLVLASGLFPFTQCVLFCPHPSLILSKSSFRKEGKHICVSFIFKIRTECCTSLCCFCYSLLTMTKKSFIDIITNWSEEFQKNKLRLIKETKDFIFLCVLTEFILSFINVFKPLFSLNWSPTPVHVVIENNGTILTVSSR